MKPKTKLQVEVWNLHNSLAEPREHEPLISSKHDFFYTTHYKKLVCLECNHSWKPLQIWQEEVLGVKCPSCQKKLNKITIHNNEFIKIITYSVVQVIDRFQLIRYFSCWKNMSKTEKPRYHYRSLFEEWTDYEKNKKVVVGRNPTWTGDGFSSSDYEVRYNNPQGWRNSEFDRFASDFNTPNPEFLPRFFKYDIVKPFHDCDFRLLLSKVERSSKVETILKAKNKQLLEHAIHKEDYYNEFWPQIKILLRNKYKISDAGIWYDYLKLLKEFGKDIRNPTIILPKNLKKAHNEYVLRKQKKIDVENAEREVRRQINERAKAEAEEVLKNIKSEVFKDFNFKKGEMKIVVLLEDEDVKKEGKILKHCVHTNGYHKKSGILLMSARIGEKRIETIEISLATYSIIQSRGFDNEPTQYHDEIINLVKRNMHKISKLVEKHKKLLEVDKNLKKLENAVAA